MLSRLAATVAAVVFAFPALAAASTPSTASPTITMLPTSAITESSASVSATIDGHGEASTYSVQYGLLAGPQEEMTIPATLPSRSGPQVVHVALANLEPGSSFYYRVVASNHDGTAYGPGEIFDTLGRQPPLPGTPAIQVQTGPPLQATAHTAQVAGGLYSPGTYVTYYVQYGTTAQYGEQTIPTFADPAPLPRTVVAQLAGLAQGTTYHYRLVATIGAANRYGVDHMLQTRPATRLAPTALTLIATRRRLDGRVELTLSGRLLTTTSADGGTVAVEVRSAGATVSRRTVALTAAGTYRLQVGIQRSRLASTVEVAARFQGNQVLQPMASPTVSVPIG